MSIAGSVSSAAVRSDATSTARRRGEVAGIEPAMRSLVQMKSAPCAMSISARNATRPIAMRQYRLRYQSWLSLDSLCSLGTGGASPLDSLRSLGMTRGTGVASDIGCLVARTPHGEDHGGIGGVLLDLLPQPLDQRVDAAHGDERLILPDPAEQRFAAEDDAGPGEQHVEEVKLVRRQLDVPGAHADAPP